MKKVIVTILLVLTVLSSSLFAADDATIAAMSDMSGAYSTFTNGSYPLSAKSLGMGGAGIAIGGRSDSFYMNPALLARRTLISIPYFQATIYHPYDMVKKGADGTSILDNLISGLKSGDQSETIAAATRLLETFKAGRGKLAEIEAGITLGGGGFALGVNVHDGIHTYGEGTGYLQTNVFDELRVNILAALGLRFDITSNISIDVGISSGFSILGYSGLVGAQDVLTHMSGGDFMGYAERIPIAMGWSVPLNLGINLNLPFGFSVGVVGRDLLGYWVGTRMHVYDGYKQVTDIGALFRQDYMIQTIPRLDLGIGWKLDTWYLSPEIAVDFVDVVGYFMNPITGRSTLDHLKIGAQLRILSFLDIRGGLNQGYWSVGAGIDLWAIKLDVAYYWKEFGSTAGEYGIDALTVRFNIGYDR